MKDGQMDQGEPLCVDFLFFSKDTDAEKPLMKRHQVPSGTIANN